nr:hypothetical protein [Tanacetum cinerariifolium]
MEEYIMLEKEKARRRAIVFDDAFTSEVMLSYEPTVNMDNPNITMEEYIMLEKEKARRRAIVFDDAFTSEVMLSYEPTVSLLNDNKIDFRIPFDEFDDEDYTVIFDKNSFSYKIIYVDNLKTDSKYDNDKVNMPSFPSSKPTISYFDDLDYFKYFEKEFPAIVYNDALTSKLDFLTEPTTVYTVYPNPMDTAYPNPMDTAY